MRKIYTYILNIISNPSLAFQNVLRDRDFVLAFMIVLVNGILAGLYLYFGATTLTPGIRNIFIFSPFIFLGIWIASAWLLTGTGRRLKGTGTFKNLLLTTGIAYIIPILSFVISFFAVNVIRIGPVFSSTVSFLLQIWFLIIFILAIREAHYFSVGKAVGSIAILAVYIIAIVFIFILASSLFTNGIVLIK